jgi:hypothetical protein
MYEIVTVCMQSLGPSVDVLKAQGQLLVQIHQMQGEKEWAFVQSSLPTAAHIDDLFVHRNKCTTERM